MTEFLLTFSKIWRKTFYRIGSGGLYCKTFYSCS